MRCLQNLRAWLYNWNSRRDKNQGVEKASRIFSGSHFCLFFGLCFPLLFLSLCRMVPSASLDHMACGKPLSSHVKVSGGFLFYFLPLSQPLPLQIPNSQRRNSAWPSLSQVAIFGPANCILLSRVTQQKYG